MVELKGRFDRYDWEGTVRYSAETGRRRKPSESETAVPRQLRRARGSRLERGRPRQQKSRNTERLFAGKAKQATQRDIDAHSCVQHASTKNWCAVLRTLAFCECPA